MNSIVVIYLLLVPIIGAGSAGLGTAAHANTAQAELAGQIAQAVQLQTRGNVQAALVTWNKIVDQNPQSEEGYAGRGGLLIGLALDELNLAQTQAQAGKIQFATDDMTVFDKYDALAESDCLKAISLRPGDASPYFDLGYLSLNKAIYSRVTGANKQDIHQRLLTAVTDLKAATTRAPGNGQFHLVLGLTYANLKEFPSAKRELNKALAMPSSTVGQKDDARKALEQIQAHPGN